MPDASISGLFTIIGLLLFFFAIAFLYTLPKAIMELPEAWRKQEEEERRREELLQRKVQIFEQAQAARARGEKFVPPADWDAW